MNMAKAVNLWAEGDARCKISSLLWARLLLAQGKIIYKDGVEELCSPCVLELARYEEIDGFKGVTFTIAGQDMRKRIRAYHRDDGAKYGHPGPMALVGVDAKAWDEKYKELQTIMNKLLKEAEAIK